MPNPKDPTSSEGEPLLLGESERLRLELEILASELDAEPPLGSAPPPPDPEPPDAHPPSSTDTRRS